jgi:hypothetical protein
MPYVIGGQPVSIADEPRNLNGPVYVPLREVLEQLGGQASWDGQGDNAGATLKGKHARIPASGNTLTVDGQSVSMSVPAFMENGKVWVPIEFFGVAFGVPAYADASNTVTIDTSSLG